LEELLKLVLVNSNVDIIRGGGVADVYIEIIPAGVSKGLFLQHAMDLLKAQNKTVDFLLAVGDDVSDEPMFEQITRLKSPSLAAFGVTVGKKPTLAESYLDDPKAVLELLVALGKNSVENAKQVFHVNFLLFRSLLSEGVKHKKLKKSC
jgi:trehalose-6-phosphatase